jgi:hypothetical protein
MNAENLESLDDGLALSRAEFGTIKYLVLRIDRLRPIE